MTDKEHVKAVIEAVNAAGEAIAAARKAGLTVEIHSVDDPDAPLGLKILRRPHS